jgi:hypothetical protein
MVVLEMIYVDIVLYLMQVYGSAIKIASVDFYRNCYIHVAMEVRETSRSTSQRNERIV